MENKIPNHIGVIIDGNRRWAKEKGLPSFEGHRRGYANVKNLINWVQKQGIKILTVFVFSTENWNRSEKEVNYLMKLLTKGMNDFKRNIKKINKDDIKIKVIGTRDKLPPPLKKSIEDIEELTRNNKKMIVNFALSYGGRAEITSAVKSIIEKKILPEDITEDVISQNLWTSDLDFLIRTGKEQRISNFLLWQSAYSELYFFTKYWPEFNEKDLEVALNEYSHRKIRRGK